MQSAQIILEDSGLILESTLRHVWLDQKPVVEQVALSVCGTERLTVLDGLVQDNLLRASLQDLVENQRDLVWIVSPIFKHGKDSLRIFSYLEVHNVNTKLVEKKASVFFVILVPQFTVLSIRFLKEWTVYHNLLTSHFC